ncbi:MAG: tellurite resistance TerB family protein [Pseudomonadales bacterium]|nr:tellurite resistance TerB family protein [Pseudomonadales bacterium]
MDFNKLLAGLTSSGVLGGVAGGAAAGALMSNKKARKHAGTLLQVGGLAALGGVAWKAYQGYRSGQMVEPASESSPASKAGGAAQANWSELTEPGFAIREDEPAGESRGLLLVQAMIAAAAADGHLDSAERGRIMARLEQLELAPREKILVMDALQKPCSQAELCARVTCPEAAAEVYLSSLLAVDADCAQAALYLDTLAHRLELPAGLVAQLQSASQALGDGSARAVA